MIGRFFSRVGVFVVRFIIIGLGFVPLRVSLGLTRLAADIAFALAFKKGTILRNLDYVFGDEKTAAEKLRIARAANRNALCMFVEMLRAVNPRCTRDAISHFTFDAMDLMDSCDVDPRATIFAVAHSGNIDLPAVWWTVLKTRPMGVVMKPLENAIFNDLLVETRRRYGFHVMSTADDDIVEQINAHIRKGHHLCILPDQNARQRGVVVDFIGRPASTYKGAATTYLVNRDCARLFVCVPTRLDGGYQHVVRTREITDFTPTGDQDQDIAALTQRIATVMGESVRQHPESYLWHHRRWGKAPWRPAGADAAAGAVEG